MCLQEGQARRGFEKLHMNVELPNGSLGINHGGCTLRPFKKGLLSLGKRRRLKVCARLTLAEFSSNPQQHKGLPRR